MMQILYGKKITDMGDGSEIEESYHKGKRTNHKRVFYTLPAKVENEGQALAEVMKAMELITSGQTNNLVIIIKSDPLTHKIKDIVREYIVSEPL